MRYSFGSLLFIGFISACWIAPPAPALGAPLLVLKEQTWDFRQVIEGQTLEHVFLVLNKGDQVLEIKEIRTG